MRTRISHAGVWVRDLAEALDFYTSKLGFEVRYDIREAEWTWVVVAPPDSEGPELILAVPGQPLMNDDTAGRLLDLLASGAMSAGILATDDCRADYQALSPRGVEFAQEPAERDGIDATFRDP